MPFELEKLFVDVFAPRAGDVVIVLYDLPHGELQDHFEWDERRKMAAEWHRLITGFSEKYGIFVNPAVIYPATGAHNGDLPEFGLCNGKRVQLEGIIRDSTIVLSMPQYSASAPLMRLAGKYKYLRIASMPGVNKSMKETGLSADYKKIAATCSLLAPHFERSIGIEVTFSTGHICYFDVSDHKPVFQDNGLLHPDSRKDSLCFANLPAGEVCTCPNESRISDTAGEIPAVIGDVTIVFIVKNNQIIDVRGDGPIADEKKQEFSEEEALCSIAEVAIGCNDKAAVTGHVPGMSADKPDRILVINLSLVFGGGLGMFLISFLCGFAADIERKLLSHS